MVIDSVALALRDAVGAVGLTAMSFGIKASLQRVRDAVSGAMGYPGDDCCFTRLRRDVLNEAGDIANPTLRAPE